MNINKFSKLKSGQYKIVFEDDSSIVIHEDLILKHELLIKKQISHDLKRKNIRRKLELYCVFISP